VRKADKLPHSGADVKKSGGLNLLEPCGPDQACNETALPFTVCYLPIVGNIILKWILQEWNGIIQRNGFLGLGIGTCDGLI
jgi:hypothetical protein